MFRLRMTAGRSTKEKLAQVDLKADSEDLTLSLQITPVLKTGDGSEANGCEQQGHETMGREIGTILLQDIPVFLVELGNTVAAFHMSYTEWISQNEQGIDTIAANYI